MPLNKMGAFTFNHTAQQDDLYSTMSATQIKEAFDSRGNEIKTILNALIDALKSTTAGDSGAKSIGVETIQGLTGNDVQTLLSALKTLVDGKATATNVYSKTDLSSVTTGSSGAGKVGVAPITGVPGDDVQEILEELKYQINAAVAGSIPDGTVTPAKLSFDPATQEELNNAISGLQMIDTNIDVQDANNHFTATKLNGVLDELFTSANSVKTNVSGAIGSPATASDTGATLAGYINTEKGRMYPAIGDGTGTSSLQYLTDRLIARKNDIATAVNNKGVAATSSDTLAQLATKIGQISAGGAEVTAGSTFTFVNQVNRAATTSTTATKLRDVKLTLGGVYRVAFLLKALNAPASANARIYVNGLAVGTLRSTTASTGVTFTEDITIKPGDNLQIYAYSSMAGYETELTSYSIKTSDPFTVVL